MNPEVEVGTSSDSFSNQSFIVIGDNIDNCEMADEAKMPQEATNSTLHLEGCLGTPATESSEHGSSQNLTVSLLNKSNLFVRVKLLFNSISPSFYKFFSAVLYAVISTFIIAINKIVLTTYGFFFLIIVSFHSFSILAIGQGLTTIVILYLARAFGIVAFPSFSFAVALNILPVSFLYTGNLIFGLGGTKRLSLPMFTVFRRLTLFLTIGFEYLVLSEKPTIMALVTVSMMIIGAVTAALGSLDFDLIGFLFVMANDVFTAANNVFTKKKLDTNDLSKCGLLYYNALFMLLPTLTISLFADNWADCFQNFAHWSSAGFISAFLLSCVMGFALMYSTVLCTQYNSALTTSVVGSLRSVVMTYVGTFIGGDYIYSLTNCIGMNISVVATLIYTILTFLPESWRRRIGNLFASLKFRQRVNENQDNLTVEYHAGAGGSSEIQIQGAIHGLQI